MKQLLLVAFAMLTLAVGAQAQSQWTVGLQGGVSGSTLDTKNSNDDLQTRTGLAIGVFAERRLGSRLAISAQPMFMQKGAKSEDQGQSLDLRISYIEIPVLLKATYPAMRAHPYVLAGPSVGFRVGSKAEFEANGSTTDVDFGDVLESVDFSMTVGGGVSVPAGRTRFFVDGRYAFGLTDINKGGTVNAGGTPVEIENDDTRTRGFAVLAGLSLPMRR